MGWKKAQVKLQKMLFIRDWQKKERSMTELCKHYGISRESGYYLVNSYMVEGEAAFTERSHASHTHPNQTVGHIEDMILSTKQRYKTWGPVSIKRWLEIQHPSLKFPASSTVGEILKRNGLVKLRVTKKRVTVYSEPLKDCNAPNQVWSADYKGQFKMGNGKYCYPLTIIDNFSRYILCCDGFERISGKSAIKSFERVFYEYGLPDVIRTDNGSPFASVGLTGLTNLSIWLLKRGVLPERIAPGHPEQNPRQERMHRTLSAGIKLGTQASLFKQQIWFEQFRNEFNNERPHQALNLKRPAEVHQKSSRQYEPNISEINYPDSFHIRKVRTNGMMRYAGKKYYVCEELHGESIGLEMLDESRANVYFGRLKLGMIDANLDKITRPQV